ncbi:hypothetical protein AGMMS49992_06160 [Clostridia bacterium]|nr:hypothetical protein AGMMS49992_06160 [Clostridia bacterium]
MTLDVNRALQQPGEQFPFSVERAADAGETDDADRLPDGIEAMNVRAEGIYVGAGMTVFVRGRAFADVKAQCARCLTDVVQSVEAPVHEVFGKDDGLSDPDDPEKRAMQGQTIDLTDAVYSALALALPMRFLCREDCAGIILT